MEPEAQGAVARIVFMGTPQISADFLNHWVERYPICFQKIVACFTQPDRLAGRGRKLTASPVKKLALAHHISVFQVPNFRTSDAIEQLSALKPTHIVVVAYGLLLPPAVLELAPCWNVHFSLLPRYRGASPIQQAILQGDAETGVTLMRMDSGLDTGPILMQKSVPLDPTTNASDLTMQLTRMGADLAAEAVKNPAGLTEIPQDQIHLDVRLAPKLYKPDARLDFNQSAVELDRKVRAFHGTLGAWFSHDGQPIKVHQAHIATQSAQGVSTAGTILQCDETGLALQTADGILILDVLQFPGRSPQFCRDWIRGRHPFQVGSVVHGAA